MKKTYVKPLFAVEKFTLTQQIAGCSYLKINLRSGDCILTESDPKDLAIPEFAKLVELAAFGYFWGAECGLPISQAEDSDLLCYYTSTNMAFTS